MNRPYSNDAYATLANGFHKGSRIIKAEFLRARLNKVFGEPGIGWSLVANAKVGQIIVSTEIRVDKNGEKTWHVCQMLGFDFSLCLIGEQQQREWYNTGSYSDMHANLDSRSALRGARSGLLKQAAAEMGWFMSLRDSE